MHVVFVMFFIVYLQFYNVPCDFAYYFLKLMCKAHLKYFYQIIKFHLKNKEFYK